MTGVWKRKKKIATYLFFDLSLLTITELRKSEIDPAMFNLVRSQVFTLIVLFCFILPYLSNICCTNYYLDS